MAKALRSVNLRLKGNLNATNPLEAEIGYRVTVNGVDAHRGVHVVSAPDWNKTLQTFLDDEVAVIKTNEGIP